MIGYWLVQALGSALPGNRACCLLCRTVVRADDPAFTSPSKFVGPVYEEARARPIRQTTPRELRARSFPAGSMRPKVEAACGFVEATGRMAAIGRLDDAEALLDGKAGTIVTP
jgi:carbamate kinase